MTSPDPTPERDYRERIIDALHNAIVVVVEVDGFPSPWERLARAVLAVRDDEIERLRDELARVERISTARSTQVQEMTEQRQSLRAKLATAYNRIAALEAQAGYRAGQLREERAEASVRDRDQAVVRAASTTSAFPRWPTRHPLRGDAASTQRHPGTLSDCIDDRCRRAVDDAVGEPDWGENRAVHGDTTTPRVWTEDDPEPPVGTRLRDRHGDEWVHLPGGWCLPSAHEGCPHKGGHTEWTSVRYYAPLTEIADGDTTRPS